jgi:Domain of unknown function (DUF1877)
VLDLMLTGVEVARLAGLVDVRRFGGDRFCRSAAAQTARPYPDDMGTRRKYFRVPPLRLEQLLGDEARVTAYLYKLSREDLTRTPGDAEVPPEAMVSVDKAWEPIDEVLEFCGFPVAAHAGSRPMYPRARPLSDIELEVLSEAEQRAEGPQTYLTVEEVVSAAEFLGAVPFAERVNAVDSAFAKRYVSRYGAPWADDIEYCTQHGEALRRFFMLAASRGDVVISWLG